MERKAGDDSRDPEQERAHLRRPAGPTCRLMPRVGTNAGAPADVQPVAGPLLKKHSHHHPRAAWGADRTGEEG